MIRFSYIVILSICVSFVNAQNPKQHLKAGQQFMVNGLVEDAIVEFDNAIKLDPKFGKAYLERAIAYLKLNDTLSAAKDFTKAAIFGEEPEDNYFQAAQLYYSSGDLREALENTTLALEKKKNFYEAQLLETKIFFELKNYSRAFASAHKTVEIKENALALYYRGLAEYKLGQIANAEKDLEKAIIKDKNLELAYLSLAELQIAKQEYSYAIENCTYVILLLDPENIDAWCLRSQAFNKEKNAEQAIADISQAIALDNQNIDLYQIRAKYYLEYKLFSDAINDLSVVLSLNDTCQQAFQNRALAYEKIKQNKKAVQDYKHLLALSNISMVPSDLVAFAESKVYELNRENNKPRIEIENPVVSANYEILVKERDDEIEIHGKVSDENKIVSLEINNQPVDIPGSTTNEITFSKLLKVEGLDFVTLVATDTYNNSSTVSYSIKQIEDNPPEIALLTPMLEENNTISLESDDKTLYIEGMVQDKSNIKSIMIDEVNATFSSSELNPRFTASINITNRKSIKITAEDIFGNKSEQVIDFTLDGVRLGDNNPMGKTWVVFIENSDYKEYPNLNGPANDIKMMTEALHRYKISKIIHKRNLSKMEMERFFAIDLRDLVKSNNVNSLVIWYAGHGKNVNNTGFWLPVDARINDEFSFYHINALKASLYSYTSLAHLLVISDACEAGPEFQIAMRGNATNVKCDNTDLTERKSSLVLTSSGQMQALDNSLFAQSFANTLLNNPTDCISINDISEKVSIVLQKNTNQKPTLGRISGLEDEAGTFFFIAKD